MDLINLFKEGKNNKIPYQYVIHMPKVIEQFTKIQMEMGYLSFDDLIDYFNILMKSPAGTLISGRIKYVMCDEAQDMNKSQFELVSLLKESGVKNVMLVGDLDQSIYEWRGALPALFSAFLISPKIVTL